MFPHDPLCLTYRIVAVMCGQCFVQWRILDRWLTVHVGTLGDCQRYLDGHIRTLNDA